MKILLVEPRPSKTWGKNNQYVGLLRIGHWLQATGNEVQWIISPNIPDFQPDEIYITSLFTYDYQSVWDSVRIYRFMFPSSIIRLGGIYATLCPEHAKKSGADEIMVGRHPEAMSYPPDPTILPYKQDFAYLFTSYGCNRACTYCATHLLFGSGITQTSPMQVVDEMAFLSARGFREIWLGDDNILANAENHILPICEEVIRRNLKVRIKIPGGMAAKDLTREVAELMYAAGVVEWSFAVESVSQEVRTKMGRAANSSEEDIIRVCDLLDNFNVRREEIRVYMLIGLPYQKLQDMLETLYFLARLGVEAKPQRLTPIPGTIDFERMGLEKVDLADLNYTKFVAPNQNNFTGRDLSAIARLARALTIERRYIDWLAEHDKNAKGTMVPTVFKQIIATHLQQELADCQQEG